MPTKVLAFHHVTATPRRRFGPERDVRVSPERLAAILEEHRAWEPCDLHAALDVRADDDRRRLLVTFDDGYLDNLTTALPILERFAVPCVIFVVTGYLDGTARAMETDLGRIAEHVPEELVPDQWYRRTMQRLRRLPADRQAEALAAAARRFGIAWPPRDGPDDRVFLDWEEVRRLHDHPLVTIGSHTVTHPQMAPWQGRLAAAEARRSRQRLEEVLGSPVDSFAFPYGRNSRLTRRAVASAGYRWAFTTRPHVVEHAERVDRMAVPRFVADDPPTPARRAA